MGGVYYNIFPNIILGLSSSITPWIDNSNAATLIIRHIPRCDSHTSRLRDGSNLSVKLGYRSPGTAMRRSNVSISMCSGTVESEHSSTEKIVKSILCCFGKLASPPALRQECYTSENLCLCDGSNV